MADTLRAYWWWTHVCGFGPTPSRRPPDACLRCHKPGQWWRGQQITTNGDDE